MNRNWATSVGTIAVAVLHGACDVQDPLSTEPQGEVVTGDGDGDNPDTGNGGISGTSNGDDSSNEAGASNGSEDEDASIPSPIQDDGGTDELGLFALGSVVIDADGNRTTYIQVINSLQGGPFNNEAAVEIPGNGVMLANGSSFYAGRVEDPTWVKYTVSPTGGIEETGRLSFLGYGAPSIDYGNVMVDEETAVSVLGAQGVAIVWDPSTMRIKGEVDLSHLYRDGYDVEVWTTVSHDGLVYVPSRWSDWEGGRIYPGVQTTILDPFNLEIVGVAEDDRCASGGRVVFDEEGYAYVMGDGRTYSSHMFANAAGETALDNCLLRIAPGEADFEEDYFYTIPSLTGGLQSISELETGAQGSGIGFSKMFYPDELPSGVEPIDFAFWDERAHRMWRIELADPPTAQEVTGAPMSTIGFDGSPFRGKLYEGESPDGNSSTVYEIDPDANTATSKFEMDGYFYGLYELNH